MQPTTFILLLLSASLLGVGLCAVVQRTRGRRLAGLYAASQQQQRQLSERLAAVEHRRSELEAVLSSMVEGVAAIDPEQRVISLNHAAAKLLSLDPKAAVGRPLQEVVRNAALHTLVEQVLASPSSSAAQTELTLRPSPDSATDDRFLQAQAAPVHDAQGNRVGAVVVLHDITRLRRLESVRRDFVANVSHEIKTPISAIKAAVETLLDDDQMPGEIRKSFTGIIARQADRLDAIVEDLLSLTRLEQEDSDAPNDLEAHLVEPVIEAARETCHAKAEAKSIAVEIEVPTPLRVRIVPTLLEQALVNLIDNAVKYSPPHTAVVIKAARRGAHVVVSVIDQGRGIEPEHLPRVFERFYRTDRARSRQLGGTGLGLSIVRHVAESLGGRATVQSQLGEGSTFSLVLQAADPLEEESPRPRNEPPDEAPG